MEKGGWAVSQDVHSGPSLEFGLGSEGRVMYMEGGWGRLLILLDPGKEVQDQAGQRGWMWFSLEEPTSWE